MRELLTPFMRDKFLHALVVLGIVLSFFAVFKTDELTASVDWKTILTLTTLLMLTKGIELSGYFDKLGSKLVSKFRTQKTLALFIVTLAALLSTFLTNDVALFITVPLTLSLSKSSEFPVGRLIIFEALAVNAGSLLTPIGNPQNILLWSKSGLSFMEFVMEMLPLSALLFIALLILTACSFSNNEVATPDNSLGGDYRHGLLLGTLVLYVLFIVALELDRTLPILILVPLFYLLCARRVLLQLDWGLLAVFVLMFIDVFLLTKLPILSNLIALIPHWSDGAHFLLAIGLSQVISNVPATLFLLHAVPSSVLLTWAVNIGGFGLLQGSMANIIALRMANDRRIWWQFHLFSIPALFFAMIAGWLMLY
ncbi:SLC13 family permease [Pectobacterium carotovorum]|uniref:SLC13 family permease n=1 Tax=Pectobacterium carotovorum TaxID=554 RepID=UPI00208C3382|nr:SLC13 family permease [Pectobacterium carotovorum]GKW37324.1 anion transporter [Pectobacterium carotovorum subsp. carotovorum]